jgi:hypothetical protein
MRRVEAAREDEDAIHFAGKERWSGGVVGEDWRVALVFCTYHVLGAMDVVCEPFRAV